MKLLLIYTPFCWPTGVPLGISYLKSYLGKHNPEVKVENLDLNISFWNRDFREFPNLCGGCPGKLYLRCIPLDLLLRGETIPKARAFFKNGGKEFYRKEAYIRHEFVFRTFLEQLQACFQHFLHPFIEGKNRKNDGFIDDLLQPDVDLILKEEPDMIGFSVNNSQIHYALALAKIIKNRAPIPIVLGGYFVSSSNLKEIMQTFPFIDFIVYKEGEEGLSGLIHHLSNGNDGNVSNLAYRRKGKVIISPESRIDHLDDIPFPDFSDFNMSEYFVPHPVLPLLSSRGCDWKKCAFCTNYQNYSDRYRVRSTENIIGEIIFQQQKYGAKHFLFCDEQIATLRLKELSQEIFQRNIRIYYGLAGFRPSSDVSRGVLRVAYASGCRWIYFGVESLTQRLLNLMRKGTKVDHLVSILRWCKELGIAPYVSLFWGFPSQTAEEVRKEAQVCLKYKDFLTIPDDGGIFCLEGGSRVHLHPEEFRIRIFKKKRVLIETQTGRVTATSLDYRVKDGLLSNTAKHLFKVFAGQDVKYEQGTFWEHSLFLSIRKVRLVFSRRYYFKRLLFLNPFHYFISFANKSRGKMKPIDRAKNDFYLGLCHERLGKYDEAIKIFMKLNRQSCHNNYRGVINFHLGLCYERVREYKSALETYGKAFSSAKNIHDKNAIYFGLMSAYYHLGRYSEALKIVNKGGISHHDKNYHLILGRCYEKMGQYRKAIQALREAEKISPADGQINFSLARCFRNINQIFDYNQEINKGMQKYAMHGDLETQLGGRRRSSMGKAEHGRGPENEKYRNHPQRAGIGR